MTKYIISYIVSQILVVQGKLKEKRWLINKPEVDATHFDSSGVLNAENANIITNTIPIGEAALSILNRSKTKVIEDDAIQQRLDDIHSSKYGYLFDDAVKKISDALLSRQIMSNEGLLKVYNTYVPWIALFFDRDLYLNDEIFNRYEEEYPNYSGLPISEIIKITDPINIKIEESSDPSYKVYPTPMFPFLLDKWSHFYYLDFYHLFFDSEINVNIKKCTVCGSPFIEKTKNLKYCPCCQKERNKINNAKANSDPIMRYNKKILNVFNSRQDNIDPERVSDYQATYRYYRDYFAGRIKAGENTRNTDNRILTYDIRTEEEFIEWLKEYHSNLLIRKKRDVIKKTVSKGDEKKTLLNQSYCIQQDR